jgi:hypothetical protein
MTHSDALWSSSLASGGICPAPSLALYPMGGYSPAILRRNILVQCTFDLKVRSQQLLAVYHFLTIG